LNHFPFEIKAHQKEHRNPTVSRISFSFVVAAAILWNFLQLPHMFGHVLTVAYQELSSCAREM
jgi:hypothetical protein